MYLWSKLSSIKWNDAWEERFYGNTKAVIEEIKGGKSIRVQVYCETEEEAEKIKDLFGGSIRKTSRGTWEEPQDLTHKPLLIRDTLVLTQALTAEEVKGLKEQYPERHIINIPAEMAFGTGDHPTTASCLRYVVDYAREKKGEWKMMDAGCGTGVLALAGKLLGASYVEAFDYDDKAVEVTEKNLILNNAEDIKVFIQDVFHWKPAEKFDLLVANLFSTTLQEAFPILKSALTEDGVLVVSGILADQWEQVEEAANKAGIIFSDSKKLGKWVSAKGGHA